MSKYSTKALPAGTVLREWRLEEVLGVGGFGIVYKGRGIYFNELVAIKEYFPSAISERQAGDTVVPIDSDSEEVHALGLKKFVEEAKLLWNLSTPTRHPNIVSVRSLFEIHGTAYMVMDFEDGQSLSKLLREGKRFNEAALKALILPIAEGLERAHRVGVLHRDIKPPNILVNDDGRPVLIDFGSARFESGDATSTKVTFHTPPYAAIEQYVKTYKQGPWTDIYALGVVMYECVMGEKPAEVLERLHGGEDKPLAERAPPGYSMSFLKAIDAAMTIRPDDRPQSIQAWLALFDMPEEAPAPEPMADDGDATVIASFVELPEIVPIAPTSPGFPHPEEVETPVPEDPSEVHFKLAGQDTNATRKDDLVTDEAELIAAVEQKSAEPAAQEPPMPEEAASATAPARPSAPKKDASPPAVSSGKSKTGLVAGIAGGVVALAALAGGGWYYMQHRGQQAGEVAAGGAEANGAVPSAAPSVDAPANAVLAQAAGSLAADARQGGAPASAIAILDAATVNLAKLYTGADKLTGAEASARTGQIAGATRTAAAQFAAALTAEADRKVQRLGQEQPWADPRRKAAASEGPARRNLAFALRQARAQLAAAAAAVGTSATPDLAMGAARRALMASRSFNSYYFAVYKTPAGAQALPSEMAQATPSATPSQPVASGRGVSPAKLAQFNAQVSEARGIAQSVIRLAQGAKAPRSNAPEAERNRYLTLDQGKKTAQNYLSYLDTLSRSLAGAKNDQEAERYITQADQTRRYLEVLLSRSSAAR